LLPQENEESKEWRAHQPLVGADVNLLGKNISQKNKEVLLDATKNSVLEVRKRQTKYIISSVARDKIVT
jgi:hypothetical protein